MKKKPEMPTKQADGFRWTLAMMHVAGHTFPEIAAACNRNLSTVLRAFNDKRVKEYINQFRQLMSEELIKRMAAKVLARRPPLVDVIDLIHDTLGVQTPERTKQALRAEEDLKTREGQRRSAGQRHIQRRRQSHVG